MANYLLSHYKGQYRMKTPYCEFTMEFPRDLNGLYSDYDVYIKCQNNVKIMSHGRGILKAYIPSIGRGNNMIKAINEIDPNIIQKVIKTDEEVVIFFHAKHMKTLEPIFKPTTSGASISPFSSKNLYWNKDYKIPDEELGLYKEITSKIPFERVRDIPIVTNRFLEKMATRKNPLDKIKADMRVKGLKAKEYIHCIGKWQEYIDYLKKELETIEES